jgi:hypothetical protein
MLDINQVTTKKEITQFDDRAGTGCAHRSTPVSAGFLDIVLSRLEAQG